MINNAQRTLELREAEGSLAAYVWRFEPDVTRRDESRPVDHARIAGAGEGPQEARVAVRRTDHGYAFMQAMGLVNDHLPGCDARDAVARARTKFKPPTA